MLTFGSLFAGIGGLDLGLERAGMTCKWQVEIDDYATRVLERHWPNVRRWGDITTFPPDPHGNIVRDQSGRGGRESRTSPSVPANNGKEWGVELICGGFPCQDISLAGRGEGLEGKRSGLFYEAIRVVELIKPRYVLLENVAALLSRGLDDVLGTLASIGFDAEWHCIPAASVGAPHIRDRVFIIAELADTESERLGAGRARRVAPSGEVWKTSGQDVPNAPLIDDRRSNRETIVRQGTQFRESGCSDGGPWAAEPRVGRVADGIPARMDRLRGLGNAVVPQVAEWIGRKILDHALERAC